MNHSVLDSIERSLYHRITGVCRLQESSDGTDNGEHSSASLGSSAGELGWGGLGAGRATSRDGVGDSSVLGGVDGDRGLGANNRGSRDGAGLDRSRAGLDWGGGRLDWVGGGVLAVVVDDGGALGDSVGLGADLEGGWLRADSGESLHSGGVVAGVLRGLGADGVAWVLRSLGADRVAGVLGSLGGLVGWGSNRGGVVCWVSISVDSGGEASDDGEGAHIDCWGDY